MSITLYLEANFITTKEHNPFFAKILGTRGEILYVGKNYSLGTENFFKGKLKPEQDLIQTPEEALSEFLGRKGVANTTIFIDDALGELKKETLTKLLNSDAQSVFVIARFEDWLHGEENKYTLSNGFDSFLISRPVITNPQRLLEFVNVFPESEEKVLDWTEHPRKLPVNSYYVFNKNKTKNLDYFAIFDSKNISFISLEESKQSLPRDDKSLVYFNALNNQMKSMIDKYEKQGGVLKEIESQLEKSLAENLTSITKIVTKDIKPVEEQFQAVQNKITEFESSLQKILEQLHLNQEEENEISKNTETVSMEGLFEEINK